ncbi:MAG: MBL fold metallo-hydrolase [Balneolaceae bacterium]|nr:MBL fold metallo-hydrolase [Balneolaceae bacterium]
MKRPYKITLSVIAGLVLLFVILAAVFLYQHRKGVAQADEEYQNYEPPVIRDFGSTTTLSVLPLVNWHAEDSSLQTEMGVSTLIQTDSTTILFDLGHNSDERSPSPLEHNMEQLGITLDQIDNIVISHNHFDHVGGQQWVDQNSFSLGNEQKDLTGKQVYTPVPMEYLGIEPVYTPDPTVIEHGIATTGTIPRQLVMGRIDEQALAINVKNKGLVLIVGCGHQTLPKLIERTEEVFDEPIYGVIGDLHYPVPEGRLNIMGLNAQRFFASGEGPLNPLTYEQMLENIELLEARNPGVVGVGGHDTSDEVISEFHETFGSSYRYVKVGRWIEIGEKAGE